MDEQRYRERERASVNKKQSTISHYMRCDLLKIALPETCHVYFSPSPSPSHYKQACICTQSFRKNTHNTLNMYKNNTHTHIGRDIHSNKQKSLWLW